MGNTQNTDEKPVTFGPYSPVRQAGDFYFVSGQVGVDMATRSASLAVGDQTRQALTNLQEALKGVNLSLNNVVKTTIFVTDMADFAEVNEVYVGFFAEPRPARSTVAVKELPRVAGSTPIKVEIEAIAIKASEA
jgi:2-iminobutanoate/2-iminopropanoate deaminase